MSNPKFNIGDTAYYVESSSHYELKIPCPMCFGKRFVTIILGDDSKEKIECGYCGHGVTPPSGQATTWKPHATIIRGTISGISKTCEGWKYRVGYHDVYEDLLYKTEDEAAPQRDRELKEQTERSALWFKENFITAKKSQIWSAGYHKRCIKSAEQTISWHKMRLCMIKEQP